MAITFTFSAAASLAGARDFNRIHRAAAQDDVGSKIAFLISAMNNHASAISQLNSAVSVIHNAIVSAIAASQVSALSTPGLVSGGATASTIYLSLVGATVNLSNFRA